MHNPDIKALTGKACASIRFRTRNEILEDSPDISRYIDDERVRNVLTWQKADGYLGKLSWRLHTGAGS